MKALEDYIAFDLEFGCLGARNLFGNEREYVFCSIVLSGKFRRQRFGRNKEGHLAFGSRRQTNKVITCRENDTAEIGNAIDVFGDINKRLDAAGQIAYLTFERIDAEFEGVDPHKGAFFRGSFFVARPVQKEENRLYIIILQRL